MGHCIFIGISKRFRDVPRAESPFTTACITKAMIEGLEGMLQVGLPPTNSREDIDDVERRDRGRQMHYGSPPKLCTIPTWKMKSPPTEKKLPPTS